MGGRGPAATGGTGEWNSHARAPAASQPVAAARAWLLLDKQSMARGPFAEADMLQALHAGRLEGSAMVTPADVNTGMPLGSGEYAMLADLVQPGGALHSRFELARSAR